MAVSTLPPIIKSQPAVEKLNTFNGCVVTVTKHMGPRAVGGQSIVPTQNMPLKQLLELQTSLPLTYGNGHYLFNVVDAGGTGSDEWMVKLGPEQPEVSMPGPTATPFTGANPPPPTGEGISHLGHGFFYNEVLQTLTTPWRTIVNWKPGDLMPTAPASAVAGAAPASTPWGQPQQGQPWWQAGGAPGGWGGFPVNSEAEELRATRTQLAEQARQIEAAAQRSRDDERERRQEERDRQRDQQFQALVATLAAKPSGPDPAVEELKRQNEEIRRQAAETQRRLEESQREDRLRAEIQATNQRFETMIRELAGNKSDPMLSMLMTMMTQMNSAATESVKAIQSTQASSNAVAERQTQALVAQLQGTQMTPLQIVQLMQQAKGESAEGTKILVESMKESMSVQKNVFEQLLEISGQGNQPAWVGVVQGALEKIGGLGQAMMERNEREAARSEYQAPQQRVAQPQQAPRRVVQQPQQQRVVQQPPQRPTVAPVPSGVANTTPQRPPGTKYDSASDMFVLADGRRIKNTDVEKNGWAVVLADPDMNGMDQLPAPAPTPITVDAPMNGAGGHEVEFVAPPPTPISRARRKVTKPKRGARRTPPAAAPQGYTVEQLREMDSAEIRQLTDGMDDKTFFEVLAAYVPEMRKSNGGTPPPAVVAKYVKDAEEFIKRSGGKLPPAIELLYAEHLDIIVEKIFPGADPAYVKAVADAIADIFGMAEGDEGGDDDGDDEGEEAETQ